MDCTHCGEDLGDAIVDANVENDIVAIIVECEWCGERWHADVYLDNMDRIGPLGEYRPVEPEPDGPGCWTEDDDDSSQDEEIDHNTWSAPTSE